MIELLLMKIVATEAESAPEPLALPARRRPTCERPEPFGDLPTPVLGATSRAVKSGSRTLVLMASLRAHLDSLPTATFRNPKAAA